MEFPELLRKNKVNMLINNELNIVYDDASLEDVINAFNTKKVSYCIILNLTNKEFLGLITETDILVMAEKGVYNNKTNVKELLSSRDHIRLASKASIASAVKLMYKSDFKNVLIRDPENENNILGVIGIRDFVSHLIEYFPETVYNVNLKPTTEHREGA